jgi:hypothetical protein
MLWIGWRVSMAVELATERMMLLCRGRRRARARNLRSSWSAAAISSPIYSILALILLTDDP